MARIELLMCDATLDQCHTTLVLRDVTSPATTDVIMANARWSHHNGKDYCPAHSVPAAVDVPALVGQAV